MNGDELLLEAAFGNPSRAHSAWSEWSRGRDLSALGPGHRRLLPPVYCNLRDAGVDAADIPEQVKQMARSLWVRTRLLLHGAAETVKLLTAHGIEPVLLKGAALVAGGCADARSRPMADFDLLVRPSEAVEAARLLEEDGWQADVTLDRGLVAWRVAANYRRGEWQCDLHWRVLWESRDEEADDRFRDGAVEARLEGVPARILRPEHALLHVILHGTRAYDPTAVRWIGDSLAILRTHAARFDWPLFVREAEERGAVYPLREALAYLSDAFGAAVPHDVLANLQAQSVPRWQKRLYSPRGGGRRDEVGVYLRGLVDLSLHARRGTPLRTRLLWLLRNLQYVFRAPSLASLPLVVARRAWGRAVRTLRRKNAGA